MESNGMESNVMESNGIEWNGMESNRMEWNVIIIFLYITPTENKNDE
jgi:hypothetical protein